MFIQIEETPNPETLKFLPGCLVLEKGTAAYTSAESCGNSSLARQLFDIEGVQGVFFGADFISITKAPTFDWYLLKPAILSVIMEHFVAGLPVIDEAAPDSTASGEDEDPLVSQIKELLETRVRPAVAQDGGDIVFHAFQNGVVYLKMHGACSGCPSSTATLKAGIENMLKYYVPEVMEVRSVE